MAGVEGSSGETVRRRVICIDGTALLDSSIGGWIVMKATGTKPEMWGDTEEEKLANMMAYTLLPLRPIVPHPGSD